MTVNWSAEVQVTVRRRSKVFLALNCIAVVDINFVKIINNQYSGSGGLTWWLCRCRCISGWPAPGWARCWHYGTSAVLSPPSSQTGSRRCGPNPCPCDWGEMNKLGMLQCLVSPTYWVCKRRQTRGRDRSPSGGHKQRWPLGWCWSGTPSGAWERNIF